MVYIATLLLLCICTAPYAFAGPVDVSQWKLPPVSYPADNPFSISKAQLGKQLFFDPRLSGLQNRSCASCHNPGLGWADGIPRAMDGQHAMSRHTPSLINIAYYSHAYFWDGRASKLETAIEQHLLSPGIMGEYNKRAVEQRIGSLNDYRHQFSHVFGSNVVSIANISAAISTFIRGIVSNKSPFDRWIAGDRSALSDSAKRGFRLFTGKARCITCHSGPAFTDSSFHNTGLNSIDPGHYEIDSKDRYRNSFRTPGLRDIGITMPYMHNGSEANLVEVIDFYNRGGDRHSDNNELVPLHLTNQEKQDLLMFLKSLTGPGFQVTIPPLPTAQTGSF